MNFYFKKITCNAICETIDNGSESLSLSFIVTPVSMWFGISDLIRLNSFPQHKYDRYALNSPVRYYRCILHIYFIHSNVIAMNRWSSDVERSKMFDITRQSVLFWRACILTSGCIQVPGDKRKSNCAISSLSVLYLIWFKYLIMLKFN